MENYILSIGFVLGFLIVLVIAGLIGEILDLE